MSLLGAALAGLLGAGAGAAVTRHLLRRPVFPAPALASADLRQLVDLMRRAHRATCAALVLPDTPPITVEHVRGAGRETVSRCEALARLARGDGRQHVVQEREVAIAVAEGEVGLAMIFPEIPLTEEAVDRALVELRQLAAGIAQQRERERRAVPRPSLGVRHETIESAALALVEQAQAATDRPCAVVTRDPVTQVARVTAVSTQADRRLLHTSVAPQSAVARALTSEHPLGADSAEELFGHYKPDRRRREDEGLAFPMRDDTLTVGVIIVFGRIATLEPERREKVFELAASAAPRMGALLAMEAAETLAMTDELTGLQNRRAFEETKARWVGPGGKGAGTDPRPLAIVSVDLDHFKRLNDRYGHEAGDAALRHVARLFRETLRGVDIAFRMGGEEFTLWLPDTRLEEAREVAERVRAAVERTPCYWAGSPIAFTCSAGVAAVPETTAHVENLYGAADAALYRAKEGGRNRVEVARRADAGPGGVAGDRDAT